MSLCLNWKQLRKTTESDLTTESDADTIVNLDIKEDAEERKRRLIANESLWTFEGKRGAERPSYPFTQLFRGTRTVSRH